MAVLVENGPVPVARASEIIEAGFAEPFTGPSLILVVTRAPTFHSIPHEDLKAVNLAAFDCSGLAISWAALGPASVSSVHFVEEDVVVDDDLTDLGIPLRSQGRVTVVARKGELPAFDWES